LESPLRALGEADVLATVSAPDYTPYARLKIVIVWTTGRFTPFAI
jgi:hypothetical protein